jgi:hypothetical protein
MRNTKKPALHAVPDAPTAAPKARPKVSQPARAVLAKPRFDGTKPTPEVSRALRRVLHDHTPGGRQPREASGTSHLQRMLWAVVVVALIALAAFANRPRAAPPAVKTYSLEAPR